MASWSLASGDSTYRPVAFQTAEHNAAHEKIVQELFDKGLPSPVQSTEFDRVFGEDPLDFLMTEFALPIYETETNRRDIERRGKPEQKVIPPPDDLNFEETEEALHKQWTERTCPEEHYFRKYLNKELRDTLKFAVEEADRVGIVDDHRAFKLFCPLDHMAHHLWTNNSRHPERLMTEPEDIPMFKEYFQHFPRPEPPMHLKYSLDEAAVIIQKRWKGTLTRRRPDIKALRRHIAAARVQYGDPRRLVADLWNRELHIAEPKSEITCTTSVNTGREDSYEKSPPLPKFLQIIKADIKNQLARTGSSRIGKQKPNASDSEEDVEPEDKAPLTEVVQTVTPVAVPETPSSNPLAEGNVTQSQSGSADAATKSLNSGGHSAADATGKSGLSALPSVEPKFSADKQAAGTGVEKKPNKPTKTK